MTSARLWLAMALTFTGIAGVVLTPPSAEATSPAPSGGAERVQVSARRLLADLRVGDERGVGYDRAHFGEWIDADGDGCDTRQEVLIIESTVTPSRGPGCAVRGRWYSAYDGMVTTDASSFDIDHVVALAEAWGSGARSWSAARRRAFANDLGYGPSLVAVSASSNRSKGDDDPAEWLPPRRRATCGYVARWVAVKWRWQLSVDRIEKAAIGVVMDGCSAQSLTVRRPTRP